MIQYIDWHKIVIWSFLNLFKELKHEINACKLIIEQQCVEKFYGRCMYLLLSALGNSLIQFVRVIMFNQFYCTTMLQSLIFM